MEQSPTSFSVSSTDDPFAQLMLQVKEAAEGIYDVLGEIGRSSSGNVVYLARELENGHLLALKLIRAPSRGTGEFDLNVVRTLDATVPGLENRCPECTKILPDWERFCFHCGADLTAGSFSPSDDEAAVLLAAVREATVGQYDIVGKMDRSDGGGMVFFARDLVRGRIVALRLKKDSGQGEEEVYSIGETQVLRPLAAELAATQMAAPGLREALRQPPTVAPPAPPIAYMPPSQPDYVAALPGTGRGRRGLLIAGGALALVAVVAVVVLTSDSERLEPTTAATPVVPPPAPAPDTAIAVAPPVTPAPTPRPVIAPDSGVMTVVGTLPAGARLTIDGRALRRWPVRLASGTHVIMVAAPGFDTARGRVQVPANDTLRWRPMMVASQVVSTPPAPTPTPPPGGPRPTCARAAARNEWEQAASLCSTEAEAGSVEAQRIYGDLFAGGHGVPANATQAATWYSKAAIAGDREAQLRMGLIYRTGTGVRRDDKQAAEWFRQSAEAGSATGMMEYAVMLDGGRGVPRSDVLAAQWFRKSSDAGSAVATRRLGRLYERGEGVPKSETEAATLYRRAADRGDAEAQYQLGRYFKDGRGGLAKSDAAAAEWFRKAAAQQHPAARDELKKIGGA